MAKWKFEHREMGHTIIAERIDLYWEIAHDPRDILLGHQAEELRQAELPQEDTQQGPAIGHGRPV